jgi:membrane protein required for colicin V production
VTLTGVDVAMLVVVTVSAVLGLWRGLVREVLSLVAWIAAAVLALALAPRVGALLASHIEQENARFVASFALVFFGTLLAGGLITWLVGKLVDTSGLAGLDRPLGFAFGGLRGAVLCIVAMVMLRPFAAETAWWRSSVVIDQLEPYESLVVELFDETADVVGALSKQL